MDFIAILCLWLTFAIDLSYSKHVRFSVALTWEAGAPDGNSRQMIKINGQFPGPQLDLDYGDYVEFHVQNGLPVNASVHFHGIEQRGSPQYDGVPGLSQFAIAPGSSFVYSWTAQQYGTYWYHGHVQGLVSDGLYGPIHIRPSESEPLPFDQISSDRNDIVAMQNASREPHMALVSDWTTITSQQYYQAEQDSGLDIYCVNSVLMNGEGAVNCQPQSLFDEEMNPNLRMLLQKANLSLTDRGCTPMSPAALSEGMFPTDPSKLPQGIQSGCKETTGSQKTFDVSVSDQWASINFISAASSKAVVVSIDEHPMWIYAVDGNFIKPQQVDTMLMYNGERYSAMIKLDKPASSYTIRIANNLPDQLLSGYAQLSYTDNSTYPTSSNSTPTINYAGNPILSSARSLDTSLAAPFHRPAPAQTADATHILDMGRFGANWRWSMNNLSSYDFAASSPPLLYLSDPSTYAASHPDTTIATNNNTWIDLIAVSTISNQSNPAQPPHPIHKHGNKGYVIGSGTGDFTWASVEDAMKEVPGSFNLVDPPYRDGFVVPAVLGQPAWVAFRYHVEEPGAWLLHCHIQTHLQGGMGLTILDGVDAWPY